MKKRQVLLGIVSLGLAGCGYRAVYGGSDAVGLRVAEVFLVRAQVPDAIACDEVASGVRDELARAGALAGHGSGQGYPRVEVEVLGAGRTSEGIAARGGEPVARGEVLDLVARAWVAPAPGAAPERETGDVRAAVLIASDRAPGGAADPRAALLHEAGAWRAAARRLGRKLGRRLLGLPVAPVDTASGGGC